MESNSTWLIQNILPYLSVIVLIWGIWQFFLKRKYQKSDELRISKKDTYLKLQTEIDGIYSSLISLFIKTDFHQIDKQLNEIDKSKLDLDKNIKHINKSFDILREESKKTIKLHSTILKKEEIKKSIVETAKSYTNHITNLDELSITIIPSFNEKLANLVVLLIKELETKISSLSNIEGLQIYGSPLLISHTNQLIQLLINLKRSLEDENIRIRVSKELYNGLKITELYKPITSKLNELNFQIRKEIKN